MRRNKAVQLAVLALSIGLAAFGPCRPVSAASISLAPATMARLGSVDERFQSYNIEMVEVTGGYFWRPYRDSAMTSAPSAPQNMPAGMDPALYAWRKPIDLSHPRLRRLAAALGPAYLRVSGSWANSTYFDGSSGRTTPPAGFNGVLTREQWKGVIEFARAVDARLVTSFAISPGTRDARGVWTPDSANALISATHSLGGQLAAAEFMNEPDLPAIGAAPAGYDAASFARDIAVFRPFLERSSPSTIFLGPGAAGEEAAAKLLAASGGVFDALSFHHYGAVSQRCSRKVLAAAAVQNEQALSDARLSAVERTASFYAALRDEYERGRPLWITETADASCGGNPSDSTFLDSFRYLDQLGRMARRAVQVVIHNTLAASDYGLLDERDFTPRPSYWAALLWRRLMGAVVLDPGPSSVPRLYLYAHCLRGRPGGVALLAINADRDHSRFLDLGMVASRYRLTATDLADTRVRLNGQELALGAGDALPPLAGKAVAAGRLDLPPASITFVAIADSGNPACL